MKNIFVLGGTGFVGRHVVHKLVQQGYHVTVATRRQASARALQVLPTVTVDVLDVHDQHALERALRGHDAVINLVAILHGSEAAFTHVHVDLPRKLASAAAAAGVIQVVHISALGVDARHPETLPSRYLRSKARGELALAHPGVGVQIVRPSVIFGAEDRFLNTFARLQRVLPFFPLACADARFAPVWVEDVATAVLRLLALRAPAGSSQVWEACGPQVFTLAELVHAAGVWAGVAQGKGRRVVSLPLWAGRIQAWCMQWLPGEPLMTADNLDSMSVDNVSGNLLPGLADLGLQASEIEPIAMGYLYRDRRTAR